MRKPNVQRFHRRAILVVGSDGFRTSGFARAEAALLDGHIGNAGTRELKWVKNLWAYELFFEDHGRAPRERTRRMTTLPADERLLGEWANRQRRHRGALDRYQEARLTASRAFQWDMQTARWLDQLAVVWNVVTLWRRLPRASAANQLEAAAARWWMRQRHDLRSHRLTEERAELVRLMESEAERLGARHRTNRKRTSH